MLFNLLVGVLLDAFGSYRVPFLLAGLMHPLSFLLIMLTLRRIEPVNLQVNHTAEAAARVARAAAHTGKEP